MRIALMLATAAVAFPLAAGSIGCSGGSVSPSDISFPTAAFATVKSTSSTKQIEVRTAPSQPPSRGELAVEYRIAEDDGAPMDGLTLDVVPWMPEMAHGSSTTPTIAPMGDGRYVISNVELFMPGLWDLRTSIASESASASEDSVTPTFQIP